MLLKELVLIKQLHQKSVIVITNSQPYVCNGCHDVLMMFMNLNDKAILNINCVDYRSIITRISKIEALNLLLQSDLNEESGTLRI